MAGESQKSAADPYVQNYLDAFQRRIGTSEGTPNLRDYLGTVPEHLRSEVGGVIRERLQSWEVWAAPDLCY